MTLTELSNRVPILDIVIDELDNGFCWVATHKEQPVVVYAHRLKESRYADSYEECLKDLAKFVECYCRECEMGIHI